MSTRRGTLQCWVIALLAAGAAGASVEPLGGQFRVSSPHVRAALPVAAFSADGDALVVWEDARLGIRGRLQRADGALGPEHTLVANDALPGPEGGRVRERKEPALAALPSGEFLLAWVDELAYLKVVPFLETRNVLGRTLFAQRLSAGGLPRGPRVALGGGESEWARRPRLATVPGGALAVWVGEAPAAKGAGGRLVGRRLDSTGGALGAEQEIAAGPVTNTALAADAAGRTLVAWEACCAEGSREEVYARLYAADGAAVGDAFRVNTVTIDRQRRPAVAAAEDGFLVVFQSARAVDEIHIHGQFVGAEGSFLGAEFRVNPGEGDVRLAPALATTPGGGFLVTWRNWLGVEFGITALELDAQGRALGAPERVNQWRIQRTNANSIAADGRGGYLVPWEAVFERRQGIAARRLSAR